MSQADQSSEHNANIEAPLKDLLDKILDYAAKFFATKEDLAVLENKLEDYENTLELVRIINDCFSVMTTKIDEKLSASEATDYDELEKVVQKHEGEIRNHIRIEQQMKLYADSIQAKLEDVEKSNVEVVDQSKAIVNDVKRDNLKLTETLRQKNEELEKLSADLKKMEELNNEYKSKLQELPQLQERISQLQKREAHPNLLIHRNSANNFIELESSKKVDTDGEMSRISSNLDVTKKSLKILSTNSSSVKFTKKALPYGPSSVNKTKDSIRIKVDVAETKYRKDLESLKTSYQKFYNPTKSSTREQDDSVRDTRRKSISRVREMKTSYNIPLGNQNSNSSLIQINQNFSHRDMSLQRLHQRSNSHTGRNNKGGSSFIKIADV